MGGALSFWNGKNVFITGHTGFKGAWLCKILEMVGANVIGYGIQPPTHPSLYDICKPDVHSIFGDIRDLDKLHASIEKTRPEIVIHMAAQTLVIDSYRIPRHTYEVNVMGTVNILECVRLNGNVKSFINVTTDKVYLNKEREAGYKEDEELNGYDPYANSKSCSDLLTSSYNNAFLKNMGVAVSAMRSGNAIGGGDFTANRLIPDCAKALAQGKTVKVRNPNAVRPYLHVLDTLFVYMKIAEMQYSNTSYAGAYNIGPDETDYANNAQVATCFCNAWGNGASWEHVETDNPHESELLKIDCAKIKSLLDWSPRWNTEKAVDETAAWYKAFYEGASVENIMAQQIKAFVC